MGRNIIAAGIDFSGISNDIQKLKTETSNIKFDKTFEKRIEKVENEVSGLNSKLSDAIKKLETLSDLTGVNPKAVEMFAKMGDEITNLQQQMKGVTDQLKVFADAAAATGDVSKLVQISGLNSELTKAGGNMTALATGVEKATKGFTKSITTVKEFADKLEAAIPNKSKDLKGMANALKIEDDAKRSKKVIEQLKNDLKLLADQTNEYNNLNQGNLDTQSIEQHKELLKIDGKRIRTLQKIRDELDMIHLSDVLDDKGNDLWLKNFGKDFNKIISVLTNETKGLFEGIINPEDLAEGIKDAFNKIRVNTVSRSIELFKQIERASKEGLLLEDKKSRDKTNKRIKEEAEEAKAQTSMSFKAGSDEVVMEQLVEVLTNLQKYADSHAIKLDVQINPSWGSKRTNQYLQSMKKTLEKAGKRKDVSEEFAKLGNIQDALGEDFASALVKGMDKVKSTLSEGLEIGKITLGEDALTGLQEEINKKGKELDLSIGKATQENIKEQTSTIDNADIKINTATINIDNGNFNGNFSLPPSSGVPSPSTSEEAKVQEKATENAVKSQKAAKETVAEAKKTSEKMSKTQIDTLRKVNDILADQRRFDDVESAKQYINANKGNIKNAYNTLMGKPENKDEYTQAAKDIGNMMAAIRVVMPKSDAKTKAELANIVNMKNDVTKHVSDVLNKVKTTAKEKVSEIGNEVVPEIKKQTEKVAKETKKATKKQTQPEKLKVGETLDKDGNVKNVELTIDQMRKNITGALDSYGNMVNAVSDSAKTLYNPEVTGSDEEIRQAYMKYYKVQERLKAAINESKKKGSSVTEEDLRGIEQGVANLAQDVMNLFRIRDSIANGTRFNSDSEYLIQTAGRLGGKGGIKVTSDEGKRVINEVAKAVLRGEKIKTDADVPVDVGELGQNKTVKSAIERRINAINKEIESETKLKEKTDKLARKREEQAEAVADKAAKKTAVADKKAIEEDVAKIKRNSKARETAKPTTQSQKKVSQSVQKEAEEYVNKKIASFDETDSFLNEINSKLNAKIKEYNRYDKKYNASGQFTSSKEGIENAVAEAKKYVSANKDLNSAYNELSKADKQKVGNLNQYIDKARIQQIALFLTEISRIEDEIKTLPKGTNVEGIKDYYESLIYDYTAVAKLLGQVQNRQLPSTSIKSNVGAYETMAKEEAEYYQERTAEEDLIEDYLNGNLKLVEENNQTIKETKENVQKAEAETKESNEAIEKVNKSVQKTTNSFEELKENLLRLQEIAEYGSSNGILEEDHEFQMADLYASISNDIDKLPSSVDAETQKIFERNFEQANEALMTGEFDKAYERLDDSIRDFETIGEQIDANIAKGIKSNSGVINDAIKNIIDADEIISTNIMEDYIKKSIKQGRDYTTNETASKSDSKGKYLNNSFIKGTSNSVANKYNDKAMGFHHSHRFDGLYDHLRPSFADYDNQYKVLEYRRRTNNIVPYIPLLTSGNEGLEFDYSNINANSKELKELFYEIKTIKEATDDAFSISKPKNKNELPDYYKKVSIKAQYNNSIISDLLKKYGVDVNTYMLKGNQLIPTTDQRILPLNELNPNILKQIMEIKSLKQKKNLKGLSQSEENKLKALTSTSVDVSNEIDTYEEIQKTINDYYKNKIKNILKSAKVSKNSLNTKEAQNAIAQAAATGYGQVMDFNDLKLGYGKDVINRLNAELKSYSGFKSVVHGIKDSGNNIDAKDVAKKLMILNNARQINGLAPYNFTKDQLGVDENLYNQIKSEYAKQLVATKQMTQTAQTNAKNEKESHTEIKELTEEEIQQMIKQVEANQEMVKILEEEKNQLLKQKEQLEAEQSQKKPQKGIAADMQALLDKGDISGAVDRWRTYETHGGKKKFNELGLDVEQSVKDKMNALYKERYMKVQQQTQKAEEEVATQNVVTSANEELAKATNDLADERKKAATKEAETVTDIHDQLANARKFFGGKDTNKYGKLLEDSIEIKNGTAHAIFQNEDGGYATLSAKTKNGIDFKDSGIEFGISSLVKKYVNSLKKEIDEAQVVSQKVIDDIDAGNIPAALRNKIASIAEPIREITEEYRRDKQGNHYLSYKVDYDRGGFDIFGANGTLLKSGSPVGEVDRILESMQALKAESKDLPEIIGRVAAGTATDEENQRLQIMAERYEAIKNQIEAAQQRLQGFGRLSETLENNWYNLTNGNSLSMNEFLGDFATGTTETIQKKLISLNDSGKGVTPEYQKELVEANELIDKIREKIKAHDISNPWDFDKDKDELKEIFEYIQRIQGITGKLSLKESALVPTGEVDKLIGKLKGTNFEKLALPFNQKKQMQDMIDYLEKVKEGGAEASQALKDAFGLDFGRLNLSQLDASQFKKIAEAVNGMTAATKGVDEGFFSRFGSRLKSTNMQFVTMMFSFYDWIRYARQALSVVQEFDKALTTISFTMNTTTKQLNGLAQQSIDMAKELGTTTDQVLSVAQIYANMQSTPEEIMERAKPTVMLSTASGLDTSTVSDYLQAVENEFEMTSADAEHIADVYESISANIAMDFGKGIGVIAEGTQVSGQLAHEAGMSFEQFAAIIAKTAETTRQSGSVIGNAWKTIISRLTKSGSMSEEVDPETLSKSAESLAAIGIQIYDNLGNFRDLDTILTELSSKWGDLSDAQQANIAYNVAGK